MVIVVCLQTYSYYFNLFVLIFSAPLGKRGWKMYYASLQDMILYLYKDQHMMKKGHLPEGTQNAIRIHHSVAFKASDYAKKQHVFRLVTADWAECKSNYHMITTTTAPESL
jgi:hypothetical protein